MRRITDLDDRRIVQLKKDRRFMWRRMDNLLYHNGIPTDRYVLGTLPFGKFVQGRVTGAMRLAHTRTGPDGVLHSYRVDSYVML
jgi:hypothetical protein